MEGAAKIKKLKNRNIHIFFILSIPFKTEKMI